MTDSIYERFGATEFPADIGSDLEATSLDPARDILLGLFEQALKSEFGDAWTQATSALGGTWSGTSPVESTLGIQPSAQTLTELKNSLPLLCVFRRGDVAFDENSLSREVMTQEWGVMWVLGQADSATKRKLFDFLQAAVKLFRLVIEIRGHPDYEGGNLQFFSDTAGLGLVRLASANFEPRVINDTSPTEWLMLEATVISEEYSYINLGQFSQVDTANVGIGSGSPEGVLPDLVNVDTRYPADGS